MMVLGFIGMLPLRFRMAVGFMLLLKPRRVLGFCVLCVLFVSFGMELISYVGVLFSEPHFEEQVRKNQGYNFK